MPANGPTYWCDEPLQTAGIGQAKPLLDGLGREGVIFTANALHTQTRPGRPSRLLTDKRGHGESRRTTIRPTQRTQSGVAPSESL
jgi:hypothetical protein